MYRRTQRFYCSFIVRKDAVTTKRLSLRTVSAKTNCCKPFFFRKSEQARLWTSRRCAVFPSFRPSRPCYIMSRLQLPKPGSAAAETDTALRCVILFPNDADGVLPPPCLIESPPRRNRVEDSDPSPQPPNLHAPNRMHPCNCGEEKPGAKIDLASFPSPLV